MSKVLRPAAFEPQSARERLISAHLPMEMRPTWGTYLVEHVQESVRLTIEATTLARLFVDSARAFGEQLGVAAVAHGPNDAHQLSIVARDADDLLSAWLGEVLFHGRQTRRLFSAMMIRRITARRLRAELRAERETRWLLDPASVAIVEARVAALTNGVGTRFVAHVAFCPIASARRRP